MHYSVRRHSEPYWAGTRLIFSHLYSNMHVGCITISWHRGWCPSVSISTQALFPSISNNWHHLNVSAQFDLPMSFAVFSSKVSNTYSWGTTMWHEYSCITNFISIYSSNKMWVTHRTLSHAISWLTIITTLGVTSYVMSTGWPVSISTTPTSWMCRLWKHFSVFVTDSNHVS